MIPALCFAYAAILPPLSSKGRGLLLLFLGSLLIAIHYRYRPPLPPFSVLGRFISSPFRRDVIRRKEGRKESQSLDFLFHLIYTSLSALPFPILASFLSLSLSLWAWQTTGQSIQMDRKEKESPTQTREQN